ncbi:hypothetical protein PINS_up010526 [Pythium insidiosum]|nr:hypothetical protein PINS_up010526 [Pythium insidiosum]
MVYTATSTGGKDFDLAELLRQQSRHEMEEQSCSRSMPHFVDELQDVLDKRQTMTTSMRTIVKRIGDDEGSDSSTCTKNPPKASTASTSRSGLQMDLMTHLQASIKVKVNQDELVLGDSEDDEEEDVANSSA